MKRLSVPILATLCIALAPSATAQISVIGGGLGEECYMAAKYSKTSFREGEATCDKAISSGQLNIKNRAATYVNRGILRMRNGSYDGALRDYDIAERLKGPSGPLALNRGAALIYKKEFAPALTSLNAAIELNSQDLYAAYYNRAIAKENLGDVEGAYYDFLKARELKPDWDLVDRQLSRFTVAETN